VVAADASRRWAQITAAKYLPKFHLKRDDGQRERTTDHVDPYLDLPSARILVASALPNGDAGLATLQVGGIFSAQRRTQLADRSPHVSSWNTWDRRTRSHSR